VRLIDAARQREVGCANFQAPPNHRPIRGI
jgi:hypothetical protein